MKLGYGLKSRSQRVVQDSSVAEIDALKQSCWANMPQELLREVLVKIEASERGWPLRRSVVACAGVCRSWREIMKEVVRTPEASGKLTFPISVKQPGPRESLLQCFIRRNRSTQTYHLYLNLTQALADDGKFLLAARKCRRPTCTDYNISLHAADMSKGSSTYIGKLRSNFLGNQVKLKRKGNTPTCKLYIKIIIYSSQTKCIQRGPRRMHCVMDAIPSSSIEPGGVAPTQTEFPLSNIDSFPSFPFFRSKSSRMENFLSVRSIDQRHGALVLKKQGSQMARATPVLVLEFSWTGNGCFCEELSVGSFCRERTSGAFAICLSSFDTKIACE
ncbi:tubby like protein 3 [Actinidia rufa]|uniref:Tubby like protein 3 n=1 Tax=Actinidia rufa TaxID=165716 RepID=A0A7J0EFQ4_9ERIC|nr:tubby like protein 3 [Actinidia rufa]